MTFGDFSDSLSPPNIGPIPITTVTFMVTLLLLLACSSANKPTDDTGAPPIDDTAAFTDTAAPCEAFKAYTDADGDGYGDVATKIITCALEDGQVTDHSDCDDGNADVHPGAPELCDGIDQDCDNTVDEDPITAQYRDADGDGYGDPNISAPTCTVLSGYVADSTDCDDADPNVHPGAEEHCDYFAVLDENCDGDPESDAVDMWAWYPDEDGDGSSTASEDIVPVLACPSNHPAGHNADHEDCDDADPTVSPDADERCDGVDQDCDDIIDNGAVDATTWYPDSDSDGYGDMYGYTGAPMNSCEEPTGTPFPYVPDGTDCFDYMWDPLGAMIHPGAEEICDWTDNDCDGFIDGDDPEGASGTSNWYADDDGDGFGGTMLIAEDTCEYNAVTTFPGDVSALNTDCDDRDTRLSPNVDNDLDGFSACDDCDDRDRHTYPDAAEVVNGYDDDCDGEVDESETTDTGAP